MISNEGLRYLLYPIFETWILDQHWVGSVYLALVSIITYKSYHSVFLIVNFVESWVKPLISSYYIAWAPF